MRRTIKQYALTRLPKLLRVWVFLLGLILRVYYRFGTVEDTTRVIDFLFDDILRERDRVISGGKQ